MTAQFKTNVGRPATRASDENILRWLHLREAGLSSYAISKREGVNSGWLVDALNNVAKADRAESGEDLTGFYMWSKK